MISSSYNILVESLSCIAHRDPLHTEHTFFFLYMLKQYVHISGNYSIS